MIYDYKDISKVSFEEFMEFAEEDYAFHVSRFKKSFMKLVRHPAFDGCEITPCMFIEFIIKNTNIESESERFDHAKDFIFANMDDATYEKINYEDLNNTIVDLVDSLYEVGYEYRDLCITKDFISKIPHEHPINKSCSISELGIDNGIAVTTNDFTMKVYPSSDVDVSKLHERDFSTMIVRGETIEGNFRVVSVVPGPRKKYIEIERVC